MTLINKKNEIYKLLVEKIYSRCQQIQSENERSVMRVNCIKKILSRRTYDVELLKKRLDKHGDNWRSVPMVTPQARGKPEQKRRGPKPKNIANATDLSAEIEHKTFRKSRKERVKKQQQQQAELGANTSTHQ